LRSDATLDHMSRRQFYGDLEAVRALVADGLSRLHGTVGELDQFWLDSARNRLKSIDDHLVAAAGGLSPWSRTGIAAAVMFGVAWLAATGGRAIGFPAGWVITTAVVALLAVVPLLHRANNKVGGWLNRWRLARAPRPNRPVRVTALAKGRLTEMPEALLRARVRLVSTILRAAGSRRWQVPALRHLAAHDRRIRRLAEADRQLCQSIDYLEIYLDGPARGRV
jgi:hypothetical protein